MILMEPVSGLENQSVYPMIKDTVLSSSLKCSMDLLWSLKKMKILLKSWEIRRSSILEDVFAYH